MAVSTTWADRSVFYAASNLYDIETMYTYMRNQ